MTKPINQMAGAPLDRSEMEHRLAVLRREGNSVSAAARALGISRAAMQNTIRRARTRPDVRVLEDVGYDLDPKERTEKDAWDDHVGAFERKVSDVLSRRWRSIYRPRGPFVIAHFTDEHIDDNAAPLRLLEADIAATHALGAVRLHTGDLLNNWPMGGKLAKQWAEQECTLPDAVLRAKHFINIFQPEAWTHGNHEEMNPYLASILEGWLPDGCLVDYWTLNFIVETPGGRDVAVSASHKFQKGSSWFHPHHGVLREMLEGEQADLYVEGHIHVAGFMQRILPERGTVATAVSSAGYKVVDKYASRISRGGKIPKLKGRAHWIVCDPLADEGETMCFPFDSPTQAEACLNGFQNLRVV